MANETPKTQPAPAAQAAAPATTPTPTKSARPRFTISPTEKSGPVRPWAETKIDDQGVGTTDNPTIALHAQQTGYQVTDATHGGEYTGSRKPPVKA